MIAIKKCFLADVLINVQEAEDRRSAGRGEGEGGNNCTHFTNNTLQKCAKLNFFPLSSSFFKSNDMTHTLKSQ